MAGIHFYTYMFTDEAFIMTSGYIVRNELAALYHQIQNVNIQRNPLDRLAASARSLFYEWFGKRRYAQ